MILLDLVTIACAVHKLVVEFFKRVLSLDAGSFALWPAHGGSAVQGVLETGRLLTSISFLLLDHAFSNEFLILHLIAIDLVCHLHLFIMINLNPRVLFFQLVRQILLERPKEVRATVRPRRRPHLQTVQVFFQLCLVFLDTRDKFVVFGLLNRIDFVRTLHCVENKVILYLQRLRMILVEVFGRNLATRGVSTAVVVGCVDC